MSTEKVMEIVRKRGLRIELKDGQPVLKRPAGNKNVTDSLLAVLKLHRERIVRLLEKERRFARKKRGTSSG